MQHKKIELWQPGNPITSEVTLFYKRHLKEIRKAYRKQMKIGKAPIGCKFYAILPNGLGHHDIIMEDILESLKKPTHPDEKQETPFKLYELAIAIQEFSHIKINTLINMLRRYNLPLEIISALELLEEINEKLIFWLEDKSPFSHNKAIVDNRAWWLSLPRPRGIAQSIGARVNKNYISNVPKELIPLCQWLSELDKHINKFCENRQLRWSNYNAITQSSAYCAAIAERKLLHGDPNLALIFYHRSTDLLLYSICAKNNLIDFTKNGGFGAYKSDSRKMVTIKNSLDELANYLYANTARDELLLKLNAWRNDLLHTHRLTTANQATVDNIIISVRKELECIAPAEWKKTRDFFIAPPKLTYRDLININNCTSSLYEEAKF